MKDSVLVLGAGNNRHMRVSDTEYPLGPLFSDNFKEVVTIDMDPNCGADILWNLEEFPWPVPEGHFDEVHAYECLEHLGGMGDYKFYFTLWKQIWTVLKPGGLVCGTTPWWESVWAWQDPGHKRVYSRESFIYLDQKEYTQIGDSTMTDYRNIYPPPYSFSTRVAMMTGEDPKKAGFLFVLSKDK